MDQGTTVDRLMRRSSQRIDTSHHASRGFVVCTTQGVIIWQGPLSKLLRATQIEIVHRHDEDVEQVLKILSIHPASNSSTARITRRNSASPIAALTRMTAAPIAISTLALTRRPNPSHSHMRRAPSTASPLLRASPAGASQKVVTEKCPSSARSQKYSPREPASTPRPAP
jgi:hypothetical protein